MAKQEMDANQVLNREFLEIRCRLIDIAASLDRIGRSSDSIRAAQDPRYTQLKDAIALLATDTPDRAQRVQMVFSDPFVAIWREK